MKKELLLSLIVANKDTSKGLANYLGISAQTFSRKLNSSGGSAFTLGEVRAIKKKYNLTDIELVSVFFGGECLKKTHI